MEPGIGPNWLAVSGAHKLAFFLYFLAHKAEVGVVADLFGISPQAGSVYIKDISNLICEKIQPKLIHMPWTDADMRAKVTAYEKRFGLPGVFGAVDGSHFKKFPNLLKITWNTCVIRDIISLMFRLFGIPMEHF